MYQRSFKMTCEDCGWYVILRRNGGMMSMFLNNFNCCPKCGGKLLQSKPSLWETANPWEQIKKFHYLLSHKKQKML